jgi:hypothetical protein
MTLILLIVTRFCRAKTRILKGCIENTNAICACFHNEGTYGFRIFGDGTGDFQVTQSPSPIRPQPLVWFIVCRYYPVCSLHQCLQLSLPCFGLLWRLNPRIGGTHRQDRTPLCAPLGTLAHLTNRARDPEQPTWSRVQLYESSTGFRALLGGQERNGTVLNRREILEIWTAAAPHTQEGCESHIMNCIG